MAKWYSVALVALLALSAGATEVSNEDKECIEERRKCEERCQQAGGTARTSCERDEARMSTECICMADMRSIGGRRFGPPGGMSQNAEGTSSLSGGTSPFQFEMPSILSDMDNLEKLVHPITWVASLPRIFAEVEDGDEKEGAHGTSDEFPWGKEMPRRHKTGAEGELKRMQMTGDLLRKMVANKLNQGKAKLEQPSVRQEEPPQSGSERQATQEHQGEEERTQNSEETNNSSVDERPTITTIEVTVPGEADRREFPREGAFPQEPYQLAGQSQYNRRSSLNDTLMEVVCAFIVTAVLLSMIYACVVVVTALGRCLGRMFFGRRRQPEEVAAEEGIAKGGKGNEKLQPLLHEPAQPSK